MPIHSAATLLGDYDLTNVVGALALLAALWFARARINGRRNTRERDWAGKMILVVVSGYVSDIRAIDGPTALSTREAPAMVLRAGQVFKLIYRHRQAAQYTP